ncbi:MAG: thiamine pyrophosphate-dependent dehydrogenase E1 component subunit alpha [Candidatus Omnitrophica bacterium]|nr:thiamine pyrophosphate-dependent dehydrogenase E1 component subunit alpha [Candidatus Omnitrophota bacterium]
MTLPSAVQPARRTPDLTEALELYSRMLLIRRAEEAICAEYHHDEMKTPVHLGIGEEAIPVGVCSCLPPGAKTFGTYRNHALYLTVTGGDTDGFFGELYGKITGAGKGKAGSMHLASPAHGLVATSAVVASTIPVAVGAAFAESYRNTGGLTAVFFGDGAVEEGVFWESLNFACLHRLRVLFVCEDNGLAIHTATAQRQGFRSIPEAVNGFTCHVASGDGSDVTEVQALTRSVLSAMAQDPGPGLLHLTYFRFLEHVGNREDFDAGYRSAPDADTRERLDPLRRVERALREQGCPPEALKAAAEAVEAKISRSIAAAQAAPFPPPEELLRDVFAGGEPRA